MSYNASRRDATSRTAIDVAVGILVGLRGCSDSEAFNAWGELIRRTRLSLLPATS